jgi:ribonuclease D
MSAAREALAQISAETTIPVENLLTPDYLRRLCWEPPHPATTESISVALLDKGARPWQISLVAEALNTAFVEARQTQASTQAPQS